MNIPNTSKVNIVKEAGRKKERIQAEWQIVMKGTAVYTE